MRAALLHGPGDLRVVDAPRPTPGPDEVVVKVARFSPYGTDIEAFLGNPRLPTPPYPVGVGADFSGIVAEIGARVRNFAPGDRVTAAALAHCGVCAQCRRGRTNLCLDPQYLNPVRQVACQEYAPVFQGKLARVPDAVSLDDAAMLVGVVDALNAHERIGPNAGETAAVVGVGAMGLCAIATFVALGLPVTAIGGTGKRADIAAQLGAEPVIRLKSHGEDVTAQALAFRPGGFDCVLETTASDWGVKQALEIAAMGGRVALTGGGALNRTGWDLVFKELSVMGIKAGHHQDQALRLLEQGRLDLRRAVTQRMSLEQAPEAFNLLSGPKRADIGRILIDIDPSIT